MMPPFLLQAKMTEGNAKHREVFSHVTIGTILQKRVGEKELE